MAKRPQGNVKRGTRAFRAIRREFLNELPGGWQAWACPICGRGVPREQDIHLDHHGAPVWLHDPGDRNGIDANTLRTTCRLICGPCNTTRGRGRTDQRVRQLRARKAKRTTQLGPTTNTTTPSAWQLQPKRKETS